jgi:hypothetical protein
MFVSDWTAVNAWSFDSKGVQLVNVLCASVLELNLPYAAKIFHGFGRNITGDK